jgi:hypothetical protein
MARVNQNAAAELEWRANRRRFLSYLGAAPTLITFAGAGLPSSRIAFADTGPLDARERRHRAFVIRRDAAIFQRDAPETPSISNGDEEAYTNRIASFTKGLPHNDLGEVDLNAYNAYLQALNSGKWADFEAIPLGGAAKLSSSFDTPPTIPSPLQAIRIPPATILIAKAVTISGDGDATIERGTIPFHIPAPGAAVSSQSVRFVRPSESAIVTYSVNGLVVAGQNAPSRSGARGDR